MLKLLCILLLVVLVVLVGGSKAYNEEDCPNARCYCYAGEDLECGELFLRKVPRFRLLLPPKNTTFQQLDLSNNRIRKIGPRSFKNISVKLIRMRNNHKKVNASFHREAFQGLNHCLERVEFTRNSIPHLPRGLFKNLHKLVSVEMPGNKILSLAKGVFNGSSNLTLINLDENRISMLNENTFVGLSKLRRLQLNRNRLTFIDSNAFSGLVSLHTLGLRLNRIRDLQPEVFLNLDHLTELDLSNNQIPAVFPLMFRGLGGLKVLNMNNNPLHIIIKRTFHTLKSLTHLKLENCKLTQLPVGALDGLSNLKSLYLNTNKFKMLPDKLFRGLHSLKEVQLEYNSISTLNVCSLDSLHWKGAIWLSGNPLVCDCNMGWMTFLTSVKVYGRCQSPRSALGQSLDKTGKYQVCKKFGFESCIDGYDIKLKKMKNKNEKRFIFYKKYNLLTGNDSDYSVHSINDVLPFNTYAHRHVPKSRQMMGRRNVIKRKRKARKYRKRYAAFF